MKILIAIDGSGYSERAVSYLTSHTELLGTSPQLYLLHVQPGLPPHAASHLPKASEETYYSEEAAKALSPAKALLSRANIKFTDGYVIGDPAEQLVAAAGEGGYDMLVMGSHGHGLFTSVALGSTVTKVLSGCKVPVLIIR